jgi:hypothetical protein
MGVQLSFGEKSGDKRGMNQTNGEIERIRAEHPFFTGFKRETGTDDLSRGEKGDPR